MHIDPLESRTHLAATGQSTFDVVIANRVLSITAHGDGSTVHLFGTSIDDDGSGSFGYIITGCRLTFSGRFTVNGKRRAGQSLELGSLSNYRKVQYFGTGGNDIVSFSGYDTRFSGVFAISLGAGDDSADVYSGDSAGYASLIGISGGTGNDTFEVEGNYRTDISVDGGKGKDHYTITGGADRGVHNLTIVDNASSSQILIRETVFRGTVRIETGNQEDSILIARSRFNRYTTILTNGGIDFWDREGTKIAAGAIIDLGAN